MGLDTSHDAFHGAYSAFNRFRQIVAKVFGGSFPPHDKPLVCSDGSVIAEPDNDSFYVPGKWEEFQKTRSGLSAFIFSNDCEGEFSPEVCKQMADELEALLPEIDKEGSGGGHIERDGGYGAVARRYIAGCRLAYKNNEILEYH